MGDLVYLNNAATSYPKPPEVVAAVHRALTRPPGDEGRGGCGEDDRRECRQHIATLLGVGNPDQVALLPSATFAINLVVNGLVSQGAHVVTSVLEHNSVLRPLTHKEHHDQVDVAYVEPAPDGRLEPARLRDALAPETALIVITHLSNACGAIQPIEDVADIAANAGVPLLIDASQSVGCVEIHYEDIPGRVFLAFAGHKGLLAPPGIGGLIVADDQLAQTLVGGTGVRSESVLHPEELPLRHEAGTPNFPGIAGLSAGASLVNDRGVENEGYRRHEMTMFLRERLAPMKGLHLLPLANDDGRGGIVALRHEAWEPEMLGYALRESFSIECRSGLHCAPRIHEFFGCGRAGTLRVSFGTGNQMDDAKALLAALGEIVGM